MTDLTMTLLTSIFHDDVVAHHFSDEQFVASMLQFEAALARVQGRMGIIPSAAAARIEAVSKDFVADKNDLAEGMETSSVPTIALVKQLREAVGAPYGAYVHWGATSQDVMDTALMLQLRPCIQALRARLSAVTEQLAATADQHRQTLMAGRTHSQQALPITFGFKAAQWLAPLVRHQARLEQITPRLLVLQFGGAVGTLASLNGDGLRVAQALAEELDLGLPIMAWHTQRDTLAEFAAWLSLVTGSLAKMAQDVILLAQSEIGEVLESNDPSRGGSSTLPHKRNPVISEIIVACARQNAALLASMHQAMIQEQERATGSWQIEWQVLPQMLHLALTALRRAHSLSTHLVVNVERMAANVQATRGLMLTEALALALAPHIGQEEAKQIVKACASVALDEDRHLVDVVQEKVDIPLDWKSLRDERRYLGSADAFIERVLAQISTARTYHQSPSG
jgi:3-carboxy-cis,cis-muconate cycloisomerase